MQIFLDGLFSILVFDFFILSFGFCLHLLLSNSYQYQNESSSFIVPAFSILLTLGILLNTFVEFDLVQVPLVSGVVIFSVITIAVKYRAIQKKQVYQYLCAFISVVPTVFLNLWNYLRFNPPGLNVPVPSGDVLSFATTAAWLQKNSFLSLSNLEFPTLGWSWIQYQKDFHFPIGDVLITNLLDLGPASTILLATQFASVCAASLIALSVFCLAKQLKMSNFKSVQAAICISCLPIVVENSLAISLASQLGLGLFLGWLAYIYGTYKADKRNLNKELVINGLLTSGIALMYFQYLIFVIPFIFILFRRKKETLIKVLFSAVLGIISNPFILKNWFLFFTETGISAAGNNFVNPFLRQIDIETIANWSGLTFLSLETTSIASSVSILIWIVVVVAASIFFWKQNSSKSFISSLFITIFFATAGLVVLSVAPYSQYRLIKMLIPVTWVLLVTVVISSIKNFKFACLLPIVVFSTSAFTIFNSPFFTETSVSDRVVSSSLTEFGDWVSKSDLSDEEIVFLSDDFYTSHFALFENRQLSNIVHPIISPGYFQADPTKPWSGYMQKYIVVDKLSSSSISRAAVVAENSKLILIDRSLGHFSGVFRGSNSDPNIGNRPLSSGRANDVELDKDFQLFVTSTEGFIDLIIRCDSKVTSRVRFLARNHVDGEYHTQISKIEANSTVRVPVSSVFGWAQLEVQALNPTSLCKIDFQDKVRIRE